MDINEYIDTLINNSLSVIDLAFSNDPDAILIPLFSGGHDSLSATYLASQHKKFEGKVYHINTGIGAKYTRDFVELVCKKYNWDLIVLKSNFTYEKFVTNLGFPGPGIHQWIYNRLKDRCIAKIVKDNGKKSSILVTGCRSDESIRRMGHVSPVKVGETEKSGKVTKKRRIWTAPCHNWTKKDQILFMDEIGLPTNKLKTAIGISGECFCGAFAAKDEIELLKKYCPEVVKEIERLAELAKNNNKPCVWGTRPNKKTIIAESGPLCSSCDQKMITNNFIIKDKD